MHLRLNITWILAIVAVAVSYAGAQEKEPPRNEFRDLCALSWISTPYDVGSDFSVKLSFRGAPLPDIQVVLSGVEGSANRAPVVALTDASGTAWFSAVPHGKYSVQAKNGLIFPSNEITVKRDRQSGEQVSINWPLDPLPVRALRGQLFAPSRRGIDPLPSTIVELVNLRSSEIIETQHTTPDGFYEFSMVEPGVYVVRVIPLQKDTDLKSVANGDLDIELDSSAKTASIPEIKVVQSKCAGVQLFRRNAKGKWEDE
jgi:hypothetical protein